MTELEKKVNGAIWDVLNNYDDETAEIGDGWVLEGARKGSDSIWDKGVALGKLDEDGDFVEETDFVLDGYAYTYADLLEGGQQIVDSMTNDIIKFIKAEELPF
jgi:hypothetical protein